MLKSFANKLKAMKRRDKNIEDFDDYIDRIKQEFEVLNQLIEAYSLDASQSLTPQLEKYLGRSLTTDENQTIQFAVKAVRDSGLQKVEKLEGVTYHHAHHKRKKKKK